MQTDILKKSIVAGILIAMADYIYLNAENKIIGAFLFPIALITIIKTSSYLYTGQIGKMEFSLNGFLFIISVLIGNIIGCMTLIPFFREEYLLFFNNKLVLPMNEIIIKSFICGMLMYIAVTYTNKGNNFLVTIMAVSAFLIGKCEHCIADFGYIMISHSFNLQTFKFILIVILFNSLGGIFLHRIVNSYKF